jgi:hypothetical protein
MEEFESGEPQLLYQWRIGRECQPFILIETLGSLEWPAANNDMGKDATMCWVGWAIGDGKAEWPILDTL